MPNTRRRRGGSRHIRAPTANNYLQARIDAADEIMNKYGCGKATNIKKLDKCTEKLIELYHDPNKSHEERREISSDLTILNRAFFSLSRSGVSGGGR